jgi:hypothetical protein
MLILLNLFPLTFIFIIYFYDFSIVLLIPLAPILIDILFDRFFLFILLLNLIINTYSKTLFDGVNHVVYSRHHIEALFFFFSIIHLFLLVIRVIIRSRLLIRLLVQVVLLKEQLPLLFLVKRPFIISEVHWEKSYCHVHDILLLSRIQ